MATTAFEQGNISQALELLEASARAFAQARAYLDLVTALSNLSVVNKSKRFVYHAQAVWLSLRIQAPLAKKINILLHMYKNISQGEELTALLSATAVFFCNTEGKRHPQFEELQDLSLRMISGAAGAQGIETQEAFDTWFVQQRFNDPEYYLPRLTQRLEEIVGDGWLFDRSQV